MIKKVARVALVNKLQSILLMGANFNYMNKWLFGFEAMYVLIPKWEQTLFGNGESPYGNI